MSFRLHAHQADAVEELDTGKVLVGDVGSGKSITALYYFSENYPDRKIVVITTAKKRDSGEWFADAMKMSLRNELIVDSWNNINKYEDMTDLCFIFDEQKIVGKGAWVKSFWKIAANNDWVLLTATPADVWMDLMPVFVANGFFKNQTQFNDEHVVWARYVKYPKVERYVDEHILRKYRKMIYVEMPYMKRAVRMQHLHTMPYSAEEEKTLWTARWNFYEDKPVGDAAELMRLLRKSTNTNPSRYDFFKQLLTDHPRVIIFYNMNYELPILRKLADDLGITVAEWNGHKHEGIPDEARWAYLVQYTAGSEGWNCIETDRMGFYSLPYSYKQFEQAHGRIDRMNTPFDTLHYHILKSDSIFDKGIWKSLGRKKNFQAGAFAKKAWPDEKRKEVRMMKPLE